MQMYKVFVKANLLCISEDPLKNLKGFKKVTNIEFVDDEVFTNIIPTIETELEEPVCFCLFGPDVVQIWRRLRKQYKLVLAAGGLVRNKKSHILFIYRNGRWDLPKGKAELGELIEETASREVKEECGLENLIVIDHITDTYHTYDIKGSRKLKKTYWYRMYSTDKELIPQMEEGITKIRWIKEEKLEKIFSKTYPSILEVLNIEKEMKPYRPKKQDKNVS